MKKKKGKTANTDDVKKDDEQQSKRFEETAKELGFEKSGSGFKKVLKRTKMEKFLKSK